MKVAILAGGIGTRLAEETVVRPKPMVVIGGKPIIWHIMSIYSAYGFDEFAVALGYKGEMIKEYFANFALMSSDLTINLGTGEKIMQSDNLPKWIVHLTDTGQRTETGGRVKRLQRCMGEESFMLTYGDGLADVNVRRLLDFHRSHGKLATVTAVRPPSRFGDIVFNGDKVIEFAEKSQVGEGWINGGFFVLEPGVFDYIGGDETVLEREPLQNLARDGQLMAFRHEGFWQPMDTIRERNQLEALWRSGNPPWKVWR